MATKPSKTAKKTKNTLLLKAKSKFSLSTALVLVAVLSVIGYFVIHSFAATNLGRSKNCSAPKTTAGYDCYYSSAEGWSARFYLVVLNRTAPDAAGLKYWADSAVTNEIAPTINAILALSAGKVSFGNYTTAQKVTALYDRALGRAPDAAGRTFWTNQFDGTNLTDGTVVQSFLSQNEVKTALHDKVLNIVAPGWNNPVDCSVTNTCPPVDCNVTRTCPPTDCTVTNTCPGTGDGTGIVIPSDGSSDGLPSLGEVSLDELENATPEEVDKIIEDSTTTTDTGGTASENAARSYSGKLKILPPQQAIDDGADEIRYYINGKLKKTVKKSPYTFVIDTTRMKNGRYALTIVPYASGEKLDEKSYVLSIKNNLTFWQKLYNIITAPFGG